MKEGSSSGNFVSGALGLAQYGAVSIALCYRGPVTWHVSGSSLMVKGFRYVDRLGGHRKVVPSADLYKGKKTSNATMKPL